MLETIHEYARERLQDSGEAEEIGRAHIRYFLALAEEAAPELTGADQVSWMDRLEAEHDNFRAALSRSLEPGDAESALRIGGALWRFWNVRGHFSEGRHWLGTGLSGGGAAPVGVRGEASLGLGYLELRQGDYVRAVEDLEASLSLYREVEDRRGEAYALCFLGWIALDRSDLQSRGVAGGEPRPEPGSGHRKGRERSAQRARHVERLSRRLRACFRHAGGEPEPGQGGQ
jgi:tetratricopeptide (TPR) repeat protein